MLPVHVPWIPIYLWLWSARWRWLCVLHTQSCLYGVVKSVECANDPSNPFHNYLRDAELLVGLVQLLHSYLSWSIQLNHVLHILCTSCISLPPTCSALISLRCPGSLLGSYAKKYAWRKPIKNFYSCFWYTYFVIWERFGTLFVGCCGLKSKPYELPSLCIFGLYPRTPVFAVCYSWFLKNKKLTSDDD